MIETVNSEEALDNTDGAITDTILKIVPRLSQLLRNNIDSLKLPDILKIVLKKIKSLINLLTDQNEEHPDDSQTASETARDESEEHRE